MDNNIKPFKYAVRILSDKEAPIWDSFIDESEKGTLFHKFKWLKAAEKQSRTYLYPLVCEKVGVGLVCVFPVFLLQKIFLKILCSPPPGCFIPELGPVFHIKTEKQYDIESVYYNSIEAFDSYLSKEINYDYCYYLTNIDDVRPFKWLGYSADPNYTYRLKLDNQTDWLFANFSKSIRNKIRKVQATGHIEIKPAQPNSVKNLVEEIKQRYSELNLPFKLTNEYLQTLIDAYGEEGLNIYECFFNATHQTTFITISYKNNMKMWLGAVHNNKIVNGINEFIHWNNILDASKKSFKYYERIGANTKHLCEHKSKYDFKPEIYLKLEKWSRSGKLFHYLYNAVLNNKRLKTLYSGEKK